MEVSNLYELGNHLKAHREKMGLEREDIALRIKISAKNLHAIEEGLLDNLPQPVFTKSFIRSYAQAMDMDMADINRRIEDVFPSSSFDNVRHDMTPSAREQSVGINQSSGIGKKILLVAGLLIVLGLAFGGWKYFSASDAGLNGDSGVTQQTPPAGDTPAPVDGGDASSGSAPTTTDESGAASSDSATDAASQTSQTSRTAQAGQGTQAAQSGQSAQSAAASQSGQAAASAGRSGTAEATAASAASQPDSATARADAAQPAQSTQTAQTAQAAQPAQPGRITQSNTVVQSNASATAPLQAGKHRVIVSAVGGNCWVGAKFDAIGERNVNLLSGRHFVLEFSDRLTLTLGNAGVVRVSHNGRPVNFTAADGDVRILRFPPN